jgi:predicted MPP superfamily phosphohydrolase
MNRFLAFIAIALLLLAGIHYYIWLRLVRDPQLPAPWNAIASVVLVALGASAPAALFLGRDHPALRKALIWPAYVWLGTMFLLFTTLVVLDGLRLLLALARAIGRPVAAVDAGRRTFLARAYAGVAAVTTLGTAGAAVRLALGPVDVKRLRVPLRRLPKSHDGLAIVQLTDLHVGPTIGRSFVETIVRATNALAPDIVALTGDLVDGSVEELREAIAPLAELRARHGVFFVTGNHEYYSGAEAWMNELTRIGIRVLRNERVSIGEGDDTFDLAGIDDRSASQHGGLAPADALARALDGRDRSRELVLLAHQPRSLRDAESYAVGLQLSGHTHGGQLWPFSLIVRLTQPFLAGLHRVGDAQIYVSRGTGYWGPPMRLGAPAEITHIVLESAPAA